MADHLSPIEIRTSPHIRSAPDVDDIMRNVVYALLPICGFAVYLFGLSVLILIAVVLLSCLATERAFNRFSRRPSTLRDYSAAITGLLLALTLPPGFPLWMGAVAGVVAIGLGKVFFGGLGSNVFNPALVGRAFVQAAFPVAITTWTPPFAADRFTALYPTTLTPPFMQPPVLDATSYATPLALHKFEHVRSDTFDLLSGYTGGSSGETAALLILLCGAYLAVRGMLDWRIPVAVLASAFAIAGGLHLADGSRYPDPLFMLLSGGLMLGAVFMATDMPGSPVTPLGVWLYGGLIGVITIGIRLFGGQPEGVMYAILLGNAATPLIDTLTQPRRYGATGTRMGWRWRR